MQLFLNKSFMKHCVHININPQKLAFLKKVKEGRQVHAPIVSNCII